MRLALADVGGRVAGHEARGADVGGGELGAQRLHQTNRRDLADGINAGTGVRQDAAGRGGGDDVRARAARAHARHERVDAVDGAKEVHAHAPFPILQRAGAGRLLQADAGIVDEDVDRAEFLLDGVCRALPAIFVHHVVHHGEHARIIGGKVLQCIGPLLVVEIAQHHLRAGFVQRTSDAEADAAGAAGDIGHLVLDGVDGRGLRWRGRSTRSLGSRRIA